MSVRSTIASCVAVLVSGCRPVPPNDPVSPDPPKAYEQVEALQDSFDDANTVRRKDRDDPTNLWDHHDAPYNPPASHEAQYWEWLGPGVTEEVAALPADPFDDGIVITNPQNFRAGNQLTIVATICTRFPEHPDQFKTRERAGLGVWIDWDYNKTFAPNENVFHAFLDVRFMINNVPVHCGRVTFTAQVPANFKPKPVTEQTPEGSLEGIELPALRARLNYNTLGDVSDPRSPGYKLPDVGGHSAWGEVEDHDLSGI